MDYDQTDIPSSYDAARGYDPATLAIWLSHFTAHVPTEAVSSILDLGCGTGRFSTALASQYDASVIGVDPSEKMLEQARKKICDSRVSLIRAPAQQIPIARDSVDMIFMSMVIHHLADWSAVAGECRRVLSVPGYVVLRNSTSDQVDSFPYINFFPGVHAVIRQHQPSAGEISSLFVGAGFEQMAHEVVVHDMAPNWRSFVEKIKRRADSILARLPESDFEAGIRALDAHEVGLSQERAVTVNLDLFVFRM